MNKVIIISIRPQHAIRILKGKKTLELRKSIPKNFKGWVYIYVTKSKPYLGRNENYGWQHKDRFGYALYNIPHFGDLKLNDGIGDLNGKIVARFWCDQYDKITNGGSRFFVKGKDEAYTNVMAKKSCLDFIDLKNYAGNKDVYAWHIKKLEIFDKPKDLWDFHTRHDMLFLGRTMAKKVFQFESVNKAPQSWRYVWSKK